MKTINEYKAEAQNKAEGKTKKQVEKLIAKYDEMVKLEMKLGFAYARFAMVTKWTAYIEVFTEIAETR